MWRLLDSISELLITRVIGYTHIPGKEKLGQCMRALYLKEDVSRDLYMHYIRQGSVVISMFLFSVVLIGMNPGNNRLAWIMIAGVCSVGVVLRKEQNLYQQMRIRKQQMIIDYPQVVAELTLLYQAGISIQQALKRMLENYEKRDGKRFAYEELKLLSAKLEKNGVLSETFSRFSQRCHVHCYMKLANFMAQNLKKGNKEFAYLLQVEVVAAYEQRKNQAIRKAQEVETKLLLPMGMQLIIVMALIMIPAVFQLGV